MKLSDSLQSPLPQVLQVGLKLLKQRHYFQAIPYLEEACRQPLAAPLLEQAQTGLIIAYGQTQQTDAAIDLSQLLCQSMNPQTRRWASRTLYQLINSCPAAAKQQGFESQTLNPTDPGLDIEAGFTLLERESSSQVPTSKPISDQNSHQDRSRFNLNARADSLSISQEISNSQETSNVGETSESLTPTDALSTETLSTAPLPSTLAPLSSASEPVASEFNQAAPTSEWLPDVCQPESFYPWRNADRAQDWKPLGMIKVSRLTLWGVSILIMWGLYHGAKWPVLPDWIHNYAGWIAIVLGFVLSLCMEHYLVPLQKRLGSLKLRAIEVVTVIVLAELIKLIVRYGNAWFNQFFVWLSLLHQVNASIVPPLLGSLFWIGVISCFGFPWLLDGVLQIWYEMQPFSPKQLRHNYPEAARILRDFFCQEHGSTFPKLGILPTDVPIIFSYGHLARNARIVVSEGLLEHLTAEEVATLYAGEIGHFLHQDCLVLPWLVLLLQIPYGLYWNFSTWGDWCQNSVRCGVRYGGRLTIKSGWQLLASLGLYLGLQINAIAASISYGAFKLFRWPLLWLSRQRTYYSDRTAADLTGNPNAYTRALLKLAFATAANIREQTYTAPLLEAFELLMPLGYHTAIPLAHASIDYPFEQLLLWDCVSPYRQWLSWNNAHPAPGDRLRLLALYARYWELEPELDLSDLIPAFPLLPVADSDKNNRSRNPHHAVNQSAKAGQNSGKNSDRNWRYKNGKSRSLQTLHPLQKQLQQIWQYGSPALLQGIPFLGMGLGFLTGLSFWFISALSNILGFWPITWILGETSLLLGCLPLGISLGIILRNNSFFPDFPHHFPITSSDPYSLLTHPTALPFQSRLIHWQGKLLGRTGVSNWLGQDLWFVTPTGLIKLHHSPIMGPFGGIWLGTPHLGEWVQKTIRIKGWLRRGVTLWIDLDQSRNHHGKTIQSAHPINLLIVAGLSTWWAIILLYSVR